MQRYSVKMIRTWLQTKLLAGIVSYCGLLPLASFATELDSPALPQTPFRGSSHFQVGALTVKILSGTNRSSPNRTSAAESTAPSAPISAPPPVGGETDSFRAPPASLPINPALAPAPSVLSDLPDPLCQSRPPSPPPLTLSPLGLPSDLPRNISLSLMPQKEEAGLALPSSAQLLSESCEPQERDPETMPPASLDIASGARQDLSDVFGFSVPRMVSAARPISLLRCDSGSPLIFNGAQCLLLRKGKTPHTGARNYKWILFPGGYGIRADINYFGFLETPSLCGNIWGVNLPGNGGYEPGAFNSCFWPEKLPSALRCFEDTIVVAHDVLGFSIPRIVSAASPCTPSHLVGDSGRPLIFHGVQFLLLRKGRAPHEGTRNCNWVLFPGGPGIRADINYFGFLDTPSLPGNIWGVNLPGNGGYEPGAFNSRLWQEKLPSALGCFEDTIVVAHSAAGVFMLTINSLGENIHGLILMDTMPVSPPKLTESAPDDTSQETPPPFLSLAKRALLSSSQIEKTSLEVEAELAVPGYLMSFFPLFFPECAENESTALAVRAKRFLGALHCSYAPLAWWDLGGYADLVSTFVPECDTLIIGGEKDPLTPPALFAQDKRFAKRNIRQVIIPGVGHFPWVADKEGVLRAVHAFFERSIKDKLLKK